MTDETTGAGPPTQDRLQQIEDGSRYAVSADDVVWLISEVRRLRNIRNYLDNELHRSLQARDQLAAQVQGMRDWADQMETEAPKPAPGGSFAEEVRSRLNSGAS